MLTDYKLTIILYINTLYFLNFILENYLFYVTTLMKYKLIDISINNILFIKYRLNYSSID
jgi:hypothetical protein